MVLIFWVELESATQVRIEMRPGADGVVRRGAGFVTLCGTHE
jgi:hypothetical protein